MLRHQFLVLTSVHINEYINFVLRKIFSRYNQPETISMNIFQAFVKISKFRRIDLIITKDVSIMYFHIIIDK